MDIEELKEKLYKYEDIRLKIISYEISIKNIYDKIEAKLLKNNLLGKEKEIRKIGILGGEIYFYFVTRTSAWYLSNYYEKKDLILFKPIAMEVFLYLKIFKEYQKAMEEFEKLRKDLSKDIYIPSFSAKTSSFWCIKSDSSLLK